MFEYLSAPLPLHNIETPQAYYELTKRTEDCAILELPAVFDILIREDNRTSHVYTMVDKLPLVYDNQLYVFYQVIHRKKLVNGPSRAPEECIELVNSLCKSLVTDSPSEARERLAKHRIRYVLLHLDLYAEEYHGYIQQRLAEIGANIIYRGDKIVLYEIPSS